MANKLIDDLIAQLEPEIKDLGYELIDLEFVQEAGDWYLRFFIWNEGGTTIEDTETVSRYLDTRLDELDPIERQYYLEVSSPDLNRPIKTDDDLRRNIGAEVTIHLYKKIDGSKDFDGYIKRYDDETLVLEMSDGKDIEFNRKDISLIKHLIRF